MSGAHRRRNRIALVVVGIGIALVITLFSPLASSSPDGLNRVATDKGFASAEKGHAYQIIPGYALPGVGNEHVAKILSGVIGVLIVAGLMFGVGRLLSSRARADLDDGQATTERSTSPDPGPTAD